MITFIAVDWPMAMFGFKKPKANPFITSDQDIDAVSAGFARSGGSRKKQVDGGKPFATGGANEKKYQERHKYASSSGFYQHLNSDTALIDDLRNAHRFIGSRNALYARLCVCGSLDGVLKYCASAIGAHGNVSRLVMIGHGNSGVMSIGSGSISLSKPQTLEQMGMTKGGQPHKTRQMDMENEEEWAAKFGAAQACFSEDPTYGYFIVYLIGCKTGVPDESGRFHEGVAKALAVALNLDVMCVGTSTKINSGEIGDFLDNIDTITDSLAKNGTCKRTTVDYYAEVAHPNY